MIKKKETKNKNKLWKKGGSRKQFCWWLMLETSLITSRRLGKQVHCVSYFPTKHRECKQQFKATSAMQTDLHLLQFTAGHVKRERERKERGGGKKSKLCQLRSWQSGQDKSRALINNFLVTNECTPLHHQTPVFPPHCLCHYHISLNTLLLHMTAVPWGVPVTLSRLNSSFFRLIRWQIGQKMWEVGLSYCQPACSPWLTACFVCFFSHHWDQSEPAGTKPGYLALLEWERCGE